MPHTALPLPAVRSIELMQPLAWLALAWRDMARAGWISFAHGAALAVFGGLIMAVAHQRFWLLVSAMSGFLIVAPVLATSFYALSRAVEQKTPATWGVVRSTWTHWQLEHRNRHGHDYWCLVEFGALLAVAATGWVLVSAALIIRWAPVPIETPIDFMRHVVLAQDGWLFEMWLALGSLLAAPIFASSVVSIPLLLDRKVSLWQAVLTSWKTILVNPIPMALWAGLIMGFTLLGLASLMLGLVFIMPMLGHASWHAYRDLVDVTGLPVREAAGAETPATA